MSIQLFCPPLCPSPTPSLIAQVAPAIITAIISAIGIFITYKNASNALNNASALADRTFARTQRKEIQVTLASIAKHLKAGGAFDDKAHQSNLIDALYCLPFYKPAADPLIAMILEFQTKNVSNPTIDAFTQQSIDFLARIAREGADAK